MNSIQKKKKKNCVTVQRSARSILLPSVSPSFVVSMPFHGSPFLDWPVRPISNGRSWTILSSTGRESRELSVPVPALSHALYTSDKSSSIFSLSLPLPLSPQSSIPWRPPVNSTVILLSEIFHQRSCNNPRKYRAVAPTAQQQLFFIPPILFSLLFCALDIKI